MVTNLAMSYGRDFMGKGQEEIKRNLDKYVSISQLKLKFYVLKKLKLSLKWLPIILLTNKILKKIYCIPELLYEHFTPAL
jgi:hypothetical protein